MPVVEAIERVGGLQAQVVAPPWQGLWTRLAHFRREELLGALERREVVRATYLRSTLHLVSARDFARFRVPLQPALERAFRAFNSRHLDGLDLDPLVERARPWLAEAPRRTNEIRAFLSELAPEHRPETLVYGVRTRLPVVQVPSGRGWGFASTAPYLLAEAWLGRPLDASTDVGELVKRHLAAFGPATVADVQAWTGLARLKEPIAALRDELVAHTDEAGRELLDLPGAPLPGPDDADPPPRLLPEYDNAILGHADRTRIVADEHRKRVFLSAGRVRATFLLGGYVAGTWRLAAHGGGVDLEPFGRLAAADRRALEEQGERLAAFVAEGRA